MDHFLLNLDYATYEYALSATLLACAMFGMGAQLSVKDFLGVIKSPWGMCMIVVMQIVVMPFVAVIFAKVFALPAGVGIGLVLVCALPGGLFSNVLTYVGKGNVALSVSATAICTAACLVTTVFVLKVFASTELPDDFAMPAGAILTEVAFFFMLPLLLGMIFCRLAPYAAPKVSLWSVRISTVLLILIVMAALMSGRLDLAAYGWKSPVLLLLFGLTALWLTYGAAMLIGLSVNDAFAAAMEVVIRNVQLGLLLKAALFPSSDPQNLKIADGVLYALVMYGGISLGIALSEVYGKHKKIGPIFSRLRESDPDLPETHEQLHRNPQSDVLKKT